MRSLILAAISVAALAACEPPQTTQPTSRIVSGQNAQACGVIGDFAGTIMEARQAGLPKRELAGVIRQNSPDAEIKELAEDLMDVAYTVPIGGSAAAQQAIVTDFTTVAKNSCLNAVAT